VRVATAGLSERKIDQPVLIFEAGAGSDISTWDPILEAVASFSPVLAYDRAGLGGSEWDEVVPSPAHVNGRLASLLKTLNVAPPYVLVGHSWGGVLINYFAVSNSEDVVGLVYIDPTDIWENSQDFVQIAREIGAPVELLLDATIDTTSLNRLALIRAPAALQAEAKAIRSLLDGEIATRAIPLPPAVPTVVINSADFSQESPPRALQERLGAETARAYWSAMWRLRLRHVRALLPLEREGSLIVAEGAGHFVHRDQPDLVVEAIRRTISAAYP
jgi:pimeloyl-ACP methyl ester carboxylesterase